MEILIFVLVQIIVFIIFFYIGSKQQWTVGERHCDCGNRRIYLEVIEDGQRVFKFIGE